MYGKRVPYSWMKTTIQIADPLLAEAKRRAARDRTTLRAIFDAALRQYLAGGKRTERSFRLEDRSVDGDGAAGDAVEGDWSAVRAAIYETRGG